MSTPHNEAKNNDIKETILLPGDPLRAKFITENFLTDVKKFNEIRNMYGFSGKYKGKDVSVMGTGMGIPSIGIYAWELINNYNVKNLIRVGSCGSYQENIDINDIILAQGASTNSNFISQFNLPGTFSALSSFELLSKAKNIADNKNIKVNVGNILSSDIFYNDYPEIWKKWAEMGILGVEMETYALYVLASKYNVDALGILTVSDSLVTKKEISAKERENSFTNMIEIALELA